MGDVVAGLNWINLVISTSEQPLEVASFCPSLLSLPRPSICQPFPEPPHQTLGTWPFKSSRLHPRASQPLGLFSCTQPSLVFCLCQSCH